MTNSDLSRVFVFDGTRLRSHLFFRYLSTHDAFHPQLHPFLMAAMFGPEQIATLFKHSQMRADELSDRPRLPGDDATYASDLQHFMENMAEAEKARKTFLANEHWFNVFKPDLVVEIVRNEIREPSGLGENPTVLPDEVFESLTPVILIRNPALAIDSIYRSALAFTKQRPGDEDFELITMNKPLRMLFDWYRARGRQPTIVDAEDILWRTDDVSKALCTTLGVDPAGLRDRWEPTPKEQLEKMNPIVVMLTKDIQESSGIIRPAQRPAEPTIDEYYGKWNREYGHEVAGQLKMFAEDNVPHYEYLKQFKV